MKKVFGFIAMALAIVACNMNEMNVLPEEKVQEGTITITAQLAPKGEITKAVSDQGSSIKVDWAVDEHIAILYDKDGDQKADARITAVDGTGKATIEFVVIDGTADNTDCTIVYPYAAAKDDNSGAKTYAEFLSAQNGTLNANLDVRVGAGKIQVSTPGLDVTTQPAAQYAIFKFTTSISANGFVVRDGSEALITNVTLAPATNSFYVAIPAKTSGTAFKFIASDGTKLYTKSISTTAAIEAGTYYQTPLDMGAGETITSVDLGTVTTNRTFGDLVNVTLTGTLDVANYPVKISIADGATVTLDGVTINGVSDVAADAASSSVAWAGITCEGDATIILSGANTVKGFYWDYPGIHVPVGKTLTIQGTGSLNASSNGVGCGIGGGYKISCGSITISSGTVTAKGGVSSAAIGSGYDGTCGDITISGGTVIADITNTDSGSGIGSGDDGTCGDITISGGTVTATGGDWGTGIGAGYGSHKKSECGNITISGGTVTATGGEKAAGIGTGYGQYYPSECGNITILNTVTQVTATKGSGAPNSIGAGNSGTCGTVTILGTVYWNGSAYQNGGDVFLPTSPLYAHIPYGAISGKFTINAGGKQVYFSQGNLKYSNNTWSFHTNQYDMCFTSTSIVSGYYTHSGTFDLFGWGTSGYQRDPDYTDGAPASYYHDGDIAGTDHDWGEYNTISNGGTGWRTPTITEWDYLLNHRTTTSGAKYARATVNSVKGLILLPDDWSISYYTLSAINNSAAAFSSNEINLSDWETVLEMHGAVFLPAFGYRYNTNIYDNSGQIRSFYWSSSQYDADDPYSVRIDHNALVIDNTFPNSGGAFVRLVRDVN